MIRPPYSPRIFATFIGSNLGANLILIGALAGILWIMMLRTKDVGISFRRFMFYDLLVIPLTLLISLKILSIEFVLF
jgi:Na+/H+ antiporter NhaD/arsenite permease-like protein